MEVGLGRWKGRMPGQGPTEEASFLKRTKPGLGVGAVSTLPGWPFPLGEPLPHTARAEQDLEEGKKR